MSNLSISQQTTVQPLPVQTAAKPVPQPAPHEAVTQSNLDALDLQMQHKKTKDLLVGLGTIGGLLGGGYTMLASKSVTGMAVGMGIMGSGLMLSRIVDGKDIGSGAVAFVGGGASIGVGLAVGAITKKPLLGALATGAAVVGVLAISKALKEN
ncbi:hypothetical protein COW36_12810 [bacterium (Candidatus Blackallbacteria) CG17_big_fil_post_rev_8_21_14_2_50_48_46]|uniref:Transmembrane protein n=1 Tax=bacterium (Candidatus Blackallbacteria) CG17_big_fil_post_rev_8_21_14_2_50_48_46 TaxID=2014261 RepID=A0A2M7G432_9BACT|nr:MAG: hypothetical protein COW64_02455 [bacterium (Candidatus Blackallbacteria) CG18_big_fil_WC_8_21_14_2_50_49_26]PIW16642.1 MAG: hypothetical protein COW36_12810 [bacterium (Candidatus Blackallbacteria) CG17_big_fil_post_rev_8_21_14_2_50_48_46]PIW46149.1 MAG: hypothetical protein COW20_18070 [bacterium (Candidatus Blackallbacteria) CG13_big_fil_rev_8_21_14_2_50_49_14]